MREPSPKRRPLFLWALLVLAVLPVFYLHFTALRAADDFYYSTFWMNGPAAFWDLTLHHYDAFNGRALVHFVAQTVLAFPPVVFAALNTALLVGVGYLGGLLQGVQTRTRAILWAVLLFLVQLLVLPTGIITEGLLWASAAYNYMLPVFLTLLALFTLSRFLEGKGKKGLWLLLTLLTAFAAGATTEQCGVMAIAATGLYGLIWAIRNPRGWWKLFPAPLAAALGYVTIFLSPATQRRAAKGANLDGENLLLQLERMKNAFLTWDGLLLPLVVAAVLLVVCLLIPRARKGLNRATPALLAGGLVSAVVMLPTGNFDPRTMLPCALMLLLVAAQCMLLLLRLFPTGSPLPLVCAVVLLGASLALCAPLLKGAGQNYAVEQRNRAAVAQAKETGVLHYSMDYDTRWCYRSLMFTENTFYTRFFEANGIEGCTVYLESETMLPVYLNGKRLTSPGFEQEGKVFFALRDVVEGFGGTVDYENGVLIARLDGLEVQFWPQLVANYSRNDTYQEINLAQRSATRYYAAAYTADVYETLWGIQIRQAGDRYVCEKAG